ncbi:hypothetical protein RhiirC2_773695 [Rhizophagus irregularis]|uniref:Galactose oxidase n=1 Tax=Rhizophagus irregularis TaxID=588596 RepID=A0A2N1NND8_9GLOM|nr:hypothetical protein RhiirC2_773695 [Rhizophagus irregularis]
MIQQRKTIISPLINGYSDHSLKKSKNLDQIIYLDVSKPFNTANPPFEETSSTIPFGSSYATAFLSPQKNIIYLFGGIVRDVNTDIGSFKSVLYSYNLETNEWTIPTTNGIAPGKRREMNDIMNNKTGKFYVFGGLSDQFTGTENIIALNDMNIFDTISLTWSKGSTIYAPLPRADYTATLLSNGIIVFIGGRETNYFVDVDINQIVLYDTTINKWSSMTAQGVILENRNGHSAVLITTNSVTPITTATITNTSSTNLTAKKSGQIGIILGAVGLSVVNIIFAGFLEEVDSIAVFSQKISVKEVIYSTIPIEYPKTSEAGVATVFNVTGWTNQRDCWNNIQYLFGSGGQGLIKDCPCFVDFDSDDWIKINHKQVENKTYALYFGSLESKCRFKQNGDIEFEELERKEASKEASVRKAVAEA